jgi:thiamine biosynthesis protein ThiI
MTNETVFVLRHGETFIKGQNRRQFEDRLRDNIAKTLASRSVKGLFRAQGRFYLRVEQAAEDWVEKRLTRVFGLSSFSPAQPVEREIESILKVATQMVEKELEARPIGTFRVTTKRSDKSFPMTSPELNREIGGALAERFELGVDLQNHDLDVGIEISEAGSFVFVKRVPGAGGLPVGVSGRVMLLLSGGIDSPVAGHLLQKRGCSLFAVYFHAPPHTSERAKDKVIQLSETLCAAQGPINLHVVRFTELQKMLRDQGPPELAVVLYRRAMMRIASRLAAARRCKALITGENLGQVASQTLENLSRIEEAASLPVLRPLIAFDKLEIIELAQRLGSYDISILPHEDTCSLFVPKHPATKASLEQVTRAEERIDFDELVEQAADEAEVIRVGEQ